MCFRAGVYYTARVTKHASRDKDEAATSKGHGFDKKNKNSTSRAAAALVHMKHSAKLSSDRGQTTRLSPVTHQSSYTSSSAAPTATCAEQHLLLRPRSFSRGIRPLLPSDLSNAGGCIALTDTDMGESTLSMASQDSCLRTVPRTFHSWVEASYEGQARGRGRDRTRAPK